MSALEVAGCVVSGVLLGLGAVVALGWVLVRLLARKVAELIEEVEQ